ncbi:unnamed protein product [Clavelina lepadiformis]|uniref:Uncharacterized protein n=1 Tax=Clavelina lepadiformis TaxID=159417 RepID=A0ABP0G4G2_CLALP
MLPRDTILQANNIVTNIVVTAYQGHVNRNCLGGYLSSVDVDLWRLTCYYASIDHDYLPEGVIINIT